MKEQLYVRNINGSSRKIQEYRLLSGGPLNNAVEVKYRNKWYMIAYDAEVVEFNPKTVTVSVVCPIGALR